MPWAKYFQDDKKKSFGIIKAIIFTADGRGKKLWAGFDSGACRCIMTTSRDKKFGVEIIPWNKTIVNMARIPMKIDGQVYFRHSRWWIVREA